VGQFKDASFLIVKKHRAKKIQRDLKKELPGHQPSSAKIGLFKVFSAVQQCSTARLPNLIKFLKKRSFL